MSDLQKKRAEYYAANYAILCDLPFIYDRKIKLEDVRKDERRVCRFCGNDEIKVSFKSVAHAVPELLGNRDIISLNECDDCNTFFANEYEDHLGRWSIFGRAVTRVRSKRGAVKYKNPDESLKVTSKADGLHLDVVAPDLLEELRQYEGSFQFQLPGDLESQPFVPIRAAKAVLKSGLSVLQYEYLADLEHTIAWIMGNGNADLSCFPVLYSFTPGPINDTDSRIIVLRRTSDEAIPAFWIIVQFKNQRLQVFPPFCKSDTWLKSGQSTQISMPHFPSLFGDEWSYGASEFGWWDWSGTEPIQSNANVSFHVEKAELISEGGDEE